MAGRFPGNVYQSKRKDEPPRKQRTPRREIRRASDIVASKSDSEIRYDGKGLEAVDFEEFAKGLSMNTDEARRKLVFDSDEGGEGVGTENEENKNEWMDISEDESDEVDDVPEGGRTDRLKEVSEDAKNTFWMMAVIPVILLIIVGCWISFEPDLIPRKDMPVPPTPDSKPQQQAKKAEPAGKPKLKNDGKIHWRTMLEEEGPKYKLLSENDIKYTKEGPMYLVVAGHVFDVSSGGKMYEEGSGYHGFIGKDGTRAFVTGKFDEEGLTPDLTGLSLEDNKGISGWIDFYLNHDNYQFVGVLKGWFFDEGGIPTENLREFIKNLDRAERKEEVTRKVEEQFPTCNVEWTAESGSKVWCSAQSGGVQRSWVGLPRLFKESNDKVRCACVNKEDLKDPRVKMYKGCPKDQVACKVLE